MFGRAILDCLLVASVCVSAAPTERKIEHYLDTFLDLYYDAHVDPLREGRAKVETSPPSSEEQMQSDQPAAADANTIGGRYTAPNSTKYYTETDFHKLNREREIGEEDDRDKNEWRRRIKSAILRTTGRSDPTIAGGGGLVSPINITHVLQTFQNGVNMTMDQVAAEKLRSFYPTCDMPKNLDHEIKRDENTMNLYVSPDQLHGNISTATLRLYRAQNGTDSTTSCEEEEKLFRVTIYFYAKTRKHRVKKKMCESKMISVHSKWAELNVRPAIAAWTEGKNLGLAVQVEDQEGKVVRADTFFRGCIVGSSTPKPIPTILFDAAGHHEPPMLPTIDICIVELPENYTRHHSDLGHGCGRSSAPPPPTNIRHQHSRHNPAGRQRVAAPAGLDPRSQINAHRVVLTNEELLSYTSSNDTAIDR